MTSGPMLLAIVAVTLAVSVASAHSVGSKSHRCVHEEVQARYDKNLKQVQPDKRDAKHFKGAALGNMRIVVSQSDLDDSSKYCTAAGQTISNRRGETVECREVDVFTAAKKAILVNNIIPAAITRIQNALQVDRRTTNLVVPDNACSDFTIPSSHTTTGVANADYVLYVSAVPTTKNPVPKPVTTSGGTLAWAGGCSLDGSRFVVGSANWGPEFIAWSDSNSVANEDQIGTAVHELLHALGFGSGRMSAAGFVASGLSVRGKTGMSHFTGPKALARYQAFLGCTTLTGIELEDEGGTGSAGSHLDKRVVNQDLMTASGGSILSPITLGVMEDLGYTPNYDQAQAMTFGANAGCSFVSSKCDTTAGGKDTWWCFDASLRQECTHDLLSVGYCNVQTDISPDLPAYFQYFGTPTTGGPPFVDRCPYVQAYSNYFCGQEGRGRTANEAIFGQWFGTGSRCFSTYGLIQDGFVHPTATAKTGTCLETRCSNGVAQFKANTSDWISCPTAGGDVTSITGFSGRVTCPPATAVCASFTTQSVSTPTPGSTPNPPSGPTTASPPIASQDPSNCQAPTPNILAPSSCAGYKTVEATFCSCMAGTYDQSTQVCNYSPTTCAQLRTCTQAFMSNLEALVSSSITAGSGDPCLSWATTVQQDFLAIAAGSSQLASSDVAASCAWHACQLKNATDLATCDMQLDTLCAFSSSTQTTASPATTASPNSGTASPGTASPNGDINNGAPSLLTAVGSSVIAVLLGLLWMV